MTRETFSKDAPLATLERPQRERYACAADGCPMPGVIYPDGAARGMCLWHYGESPSDWPRITSRMHDWRPVADAISTGRRFLIHPDTCNDAKAQDIALLQAGELMRRLIGPKWGTRFFPRAGDSYGQWISRITGLFTEALAGKLEPEKENDA